MAFHKRGGHKRPYKTPSRKSARKQYQEYMRANYVMQSDPTTATHKAVKK